VAEWDEVRGERDRLQQAAFAGPSAARPARAAPAASSATPQVISDPLAADLIGGRTRKSGRPRIPGVRWCGWADVSLSAEPPHRFDQRTKSPSYMTAPARTLRSCSTQGFRSVPGAALCGAPGASTTGPSPRQFRSRRSPTRVRQTPVSVTGVKRSGDPASRGLKPWRTVPCVPTPPKGEPFSQLVRAARD
jgi:hypothetical protein